MHDKSFIPLLVGENLAVTVEDLNNIIMIYEKWNLGWGKSSEPKS